MIDKQHDQRLFFIAATFGKYMQFYAEQNRCIVDDEVIHSAVASIQDELIDWYRQKGLSEYEQDLIADYLEMIQERMYTLLPEEAERLK